MGYNNSSVSARYSNGSYGGSNAGYSKSYSPNMGYTPLQIINNHWFDHGPTEYLDSSKHTYKASPGGNGRGLSLTVNPSENECCSGGGSKHKHNGGLESKF